MRPATGLFGIIAVLTGLWTGPFFHIHEVDDVHAHDGLATLHSHFSEMSPDPDGSETRIENGHHPHKGIAVTVIAGSGRKTQTIIAELQSTHVILEPSILTGFGVEVPVRAHDPPTRRNSGPRSPPA